AGEFGYPTGIAMAPDRAIYVVDTYGDRVEIFSEAGAYLGEFGGTGTGNGQFQFPVNIAIGPDFSTYVGDVDNFRVQKFAAKNTPVVMTTWGRLKRRYR